MTENSRLTKLILAAILTLLLTIRSALGVEVTILYWGDRFARDFPVRKSETDTTLIGGAAQLAGMVGTIRKANPDAFLFVAGGDLAGTLAASESKGVTPAKILRLFKPDAYGPGVVDFTHGVEQLKKALGKGRVGAVLSNVHLENEGRFLPSDTLFDDGNVKVAVTALVPIRLPELVPRDGVKGLVVSDPFGITREFVKSRRQYADLLVVLSQLGREHDSLLAASIPGIDLIIEGHSRAPFDPILQVGRTLIVSSGPRGLYLGKVRLNVSTDVRQVDLIDHELLPVESGVERPDPIVKRSVFELEQRYERQKGKKIATLLTDWNIDPVAPANLPQWTADVMRQTSASTKLSLVNNLDFERGIKRGDLYENELCDVMPFDVPLVAFQIRGYEIRRIIEKCRSSALPFLTWSGLSVVIENEQVQEIVIDNEGSLRDRSEYAVVTNGLLWDRFKLETGLLPEVRPIFIFPITQRQLLLDAARRQRIISTPLDDRWIIR